MHLRPALSASGCAALALLLLSGLPRMAAARLDAWRLIGPGGGGAQFAPAISPHDPNLVLVTCDMSGSFISHDGGASWRMFSLRSGTRQFAFDPHNADIIYAVAGAGVWRSEDSGATWRAVYPASIKSLVYLADDEAPSAINGESSAAYAVAVDPADSRTLYVGFANLLYRSQDGGKSWHKLATMPAAAMKIYPDPRSPQDDRRLYLVGGSWTGIWESGQLKAAGGPQGASWIYGSALGFPADGGDPVLYAITDFKTVNGALTGGLLVSRDGGQSWQSAQDPLLALRPPHAALPNFRAVATSWTHPQVVYLSYSGLALAAQPGRTFLGVAKSSDGGASWNLVWKESDRGGDNIHDAWSSETYGPDWGENPLGLAVQDGNPDIVYATDYARTMRSTDGGRNWYAVYSRKVKGGGYTSTGLDVTTCYGIHFDPFEAKRQFISYTDDGIFRSEDGGHSWISSITGIPRGWRNTTYWIVFDPKVRGRVWAATSGTHDLPRTKMFRHKSPATFKGGVCLSRDGGRTWAPSNQGMPETAITHLVLDPNSPPQARVLYAAGFGRGVFQSVDGGKSWTLKNHGLTGAQPLAWRLTLDRNRTLYLVTIRRSEDGSYGDDRDGMLFRSGDGAETWRRISLPAGVNGPTSLAVDPEDANRLYLSAWARAARTPQQGGIYLSTDGGANWRNVLSEDQYVYDVTVSSYDRKVLFAAGFQCSIWRSNDAGEHWHRLRGYNFKAAHRVIPDPLNAGMIYVATYGSSIWHGPAAGDPQAPEDIAGPPPVRFSK